MRFKWKRSATILLLAHNGIASGAWKRAASRCPASLASAKLSRQTPYTSEVRFLLLLLCGLELRHPYPAAAFAGVLVEAWAIEACVDNIEQLDPLRHLRHGELIGGCCLNGGEAVVGTTRVSSSWGGIRESDAPFSAFTNRPGVELDIESLDRDLPQVSVLPLSGRQGGRQGGFFHHWSTLCRPDGAVCLEQKVWIGREDWIKLS